MTARYPMTAIALLGALGIAGMGVEASAAEDKAELFQAVDLDGSGTIDLSELRTTTAAWSFAVDTDGDGVFTLNETIRGWEGASALKAEEILNALDADGDDEVQREEFVEAAVSRMDTEEAQKMTLFDAVDENGDGVIAPQELRTSSAEWSFAVDVDEDGWLGRDEVVSGWEGASAIKAETIVDALDTNNSGEVQRDEFTVVTVSGLEDRRATLFDAVDASDDGAVQLSELRTNTAEWSFAVDVDGDGTYSQDETIHGWKGASALKAEEILNTLDADGSGEIERGEFVGVDVAQYQS